MEKQEDVRSHAEVEKKVKPVSEVKVTFGTVR
jgi:hypothetical protein